jgi:hypothetical protein
LRNELEGLHVIFVLVQLLNIVLDVYFVLARLLFHLIEEEGNVLVGALPNLRGDADVGDRRPGVEKVVEKLHEVALADFAALLFAALLLLGDHLEGNASLVDVAAAFQDFHVFYEVLEVNLSGFSVTSPSLSRSKALNIRSEKS